MDKFINSALNNVEGLRSRTVGSGIEVIDIETDMASATVSLYGGQILDWRPKQTTHPVLWASNRANFTQGKPIRAGVPICWPWFGSHPSNIELQGHGYARLSPWELDSAEAQVDGAVALRLSMSKSSLAVEPWAGALQLSISLLIGRQLTIELSTRNIGDQNVEFSEGLHTYFWVSEINQTTVSGLDGVTYIDLLDRNARRRQIGNVHFEGELGRVYIDSQHECVIHDHVLQRDIKVSKISSRSTAVWNPGLETASKMADLGPEGWRSLVCVESANAFENRVVVMPGETHTLSVCYRVQPMTGPE